MAGFLSEKGLRVLQNGYNVIPIKPGDKAPSIDNWETIKTSEKDLTRWLGNGRASHGIGITTALTPLVDFDIFHKPMLRHMVGYTETVIGFAPVRIGNAPKRGLLFRTEVPFRKISSKIFTDSDGKKAQIEILCDGQQFVAFHIHPDTKKPYRWLHNESPELTPVDQLPLFKEEHGRMIVAEFERHAAELGWIERKRAAALPALTPEDDPFGLDNEQCGLTDEEIREKLMLIPNGEMFDERDDWLKVGFAVHHETGGSDFGEELWREWSEQHPSHEEELFDKAWNSFGKRSESFRGVTFRYILKIAKEYEKAAVAEQVDELLRRMAAATGTEELREVAADCRRLEVDLIDRSRLIAGFQKAMKTVANTALGIREAREMVRFRPSAEETPEWLLGWAYLQHTKQFYNRATGQRIDREAFDAAFGRNVGTEISASKYALDTVKIAVFHMTLYLPSAEETFTDANGLEWINTYSEKSVPPVPETVTARDAKNVKIVENHAAHLFDSKHEIAIFHSWLAYIVQTKKRPNWAIIMQGAEGTGKSFYADLMAVVLGGPNVYILSAETLQRSDFTAWAEGHQLVFMEELKQHGHNRFDIPNKLKQYITNSSVEIHPKGVNPYNVPNTTAYLAATNYRDALPLGIGDTRYYVMMSIWQTKEAIETFKKRNPSYYPDLWKALEESPGAIRKWLLDYPIHAEFNPTERAPFSHGKEQMIEEAKPEEQAIIEEFIADKKHPLVTRDFIVVHILKELMADDLGDITGQMATPIGVKRLLTDAGFRPIKRLRVGEERFSCWTTSHEIAQMNPDQLKKLISDRLEEADSL